jgi:glycyl-tRNA synthetase (class II)
MLAFRTLLVQASHHLLPLFPHIYCHLDTSGAAVGRRYARSDEIGIPFGITIDFVTLQDSTVTVRERDSMKQIRAKVLLKYLWSASL